MKKSTAGKCTICGTETHDCFPYYEASAMTNSSKQIQEGLLETRTTTTNSYSNVIERSGYLCNNCIKKDKWTGLINRTKFLGAALAIALVVFLIAQENGVVAVAGIAAFVAGAVLLYLLLSFAITLISSNGSVVLVDYLKRQTPHKSHLYFTPAKAPKIRKSS